jgi:hypothetical protein
MSGPSVKSLLTEAKRALAELKLSDCDNSDYFDFVEQALKALPSEIQKLWKRGDAYDSGLLEKKNRLAMILRNESWRRDAYRKMVKIESLRTEPGGEIPVERRAEYEKAKVDHKRYKNVVATAVYEEKYKRLCESKAQCARAKRSGRALAPAAPAEHPDAVFGGGSSIADTSSTAGMGPVSSGLRDNGVCGNPSEPDCRHPLTPVILFIYAGS